MYKQSRYLIFLILIISSSIYAQQRTLVFNNEGRIVKNYGYDSNHKIEDSIDFLIENPQKNYAYYLLYEWRNEYNYSANIIENKKLFVEKFKDGHLSIVDPREVNKPNERYMNFIFLKTNTKGVERLTDKKEISLKEILQPEKITLSSDNITVLFSQWKKLKESQNNKENTSRTDQAIIDQNKKIEKLEKQIEVIKLALDKLGMIDEADETPNKIVELQTNLNRFELDLIEEKFSKTSAEEEQKTNDNEIQKAEKEITTYLSSIQQNSVAYYNILHQGVLISKDKFVKEIVYDVYKGKLFNTDKELLRVARLTPNLPQLTTDSELYCHIINLKPDDLEKNPFIISMEAELSEQVEVESPSNIRALQELDYGLPDLEHKVDASENHLDGTFNIPEAINNLDTILANISGKNSIDEIEKDYYNDKLALLSGYKGELSESDNSDFTLKFNTFLENPDIVKFTSLIEDLRKKFELLLFIEDIKKYFPKSNYTPVAYSEFILKYPRPFEAQRKPTIKLFSKQFKTENYVQKIDKGVSEKASYDIKYEQSILIEDELPPVHRLFRFSVNAGVLLTNSNSYNYEQVPLANSNVSDLKEVKETSIDFRPSITFSTYLWKQDLAVNIPLKRFYETTHIDVSIDYDNDDILDNIYLGVGIEPVRNIQLAVGARFGQVDRLKPENFDPLLPISDQKFSSELDVGYYVSLSLGFNLIPKFYNIIVKK